MKKDFDAKYEKKLDAKMKPAMKKLEKCKDNADVKAIGEAMAGM